jgi:hypothetical protein
MAEEKASGDAQARFEAGSNLSTDPDCASGASLVPSSAGLPLLLRTLIDGRYGYVSHRLNYLVGSERSTARLNLPTRSRRVPVPCRHSSTYRFPLLRHVCRKLQVYGRLQQGELTG